MNRLQSVGKDVWLCEGGNVSFYGFACSTRMVVVRLSDGGMWIWSPIDLNEALAKEVASLGPVAHLVSPNKIHHLFLQQWKEKFPDALWRRWQAFMASFWGIMGGKAPLEWRLYFLQKTSPRAARDRLLALTPRQVIMAHGEWQRSGGTEFLQKSLSWLG